MARAGRKWRKPAIEPLEHRALLATTDAPALLLGLTAGSLARVERRIESAFPNLDAEPVSRSLLRVTADAQTRLGDAAAVLNRLPGVRFVEPDQRLTVAAVQPSDPAFAQQWGLENGNDVDINAPRAWDFSTGSYGTIVAVIDSGIDVNHPDLASRLWVNPREIAGNKIDDDGNGYVDDVNGWNFLNRNADLSDEAAHGSHVAGIIAAASNNNLGVAGVDWNARIMPLKFIDGSGDGSLSDAVKGIYYAVNNGARVINASWGGPGPSKALNDAIRFANAKGVVFVTAAGNESSNNDIYRNYPASYRLPNVLVVAAVDESGRLAGFSNFGKKTVDLAAPGVNIRSTLPGGGYGSISGTSMSAPFASGVLSLLVSQNPELSAAQLIRRVVGTTKPLASLTNRTISGGMLDAGQALNPAVPTRNPLAVAPKAPAKRAPAKIVLKSRLSALAGDNTRAEILGTSDYFALQGGSNELFLRGLYRDVLDRSIGASELASMLAALRSGTSRAQVARSLLGTAEAQRTKVARWYKFDLGSTASIAVLKGYGPAVQLANRMVNKAGESLVHAAFFGSSEYLNYHGGSVLGAIGGMYRSILAREISSDESAYWMGRVAGGVKLADLALGLLASAEGRRVRVAGWYRNDLQRGEPLDQLKDDSGVIGWATRIVD